MNHRLSLIAAWCVVLAAAGSLLVAPLSAEAQMHETSEHHVESAALAKPAVAAGASNLSQALKALEAAEKAIKAGQTETALAHLAKARELIKAETALSVVNALCPMMGTKMDPAHVLPDLTRMFRSQRVGFCCAGCPTAWDKLNDEQKAAKLKTALSAPATKPAAPAAAPKAEAKVVNVRCPIKGTKMDQANVPPSLTRMFRGQKVGFCCAGCPTAWDKLTDAEKNAKLAKVK